MRRFTAIFLALFFLAAPAFAAPPVNEQGAAELKEIVDDMVTLQLAMLSEAGQGFFMSGDAEVTPKDTYYQVVLPGLGMRMDGETFDIGDVIFNMSPGDQGEYRTSMAIPSEMTLDLKKEGVKVVLNIGSQKFAGIFRPEYRSFTQFESAYGDITVVGTAPDGEQFTARLGSIKTIRDLKLDGPDTWSGPENFESKDFTFKIDGDEGMDIRLDRIAGSTTYEKRNLKFDSEVEREIQELFKDHDMPMNEAKQNELVRKMLSTSENMMNTFSTELVFQGLNAVIKQRKPRNPQQAQKPPVTVTLGKLETGFGAQDMMQDLGRIVFRTSMEGFSLSHLNEAERILMPHAANFDIRLNDLPMRSLVEAITALIDSAIDTTFATEEVKKPYEKSAVRREGQRDMMTSLFAIPQMLAHRGSSLVIQNTHVTTPSLLSRLEGTFSLRLTPAGSQKRSLPQGSMTLKIRGMEQTIDTLMKESEAGGAEGMAAMQYAQMLGMAQAQGRAEEDAGANVWVYKLEFTEDGKLLLNGADVSMVMGMLGGGMMGGGPPGGGLAPQALPQNGLDMDTGAQ